MRTSSLLGAAGCTLALVGLNMAPAFAQGKTEQGVDTARSICAYSGLNDDPTEAFPFDGRVQSYGQLVKRDMKAFIPNPGTACNPNTPPPPEEEH